ncbi:hypothetical protein C499_10514 [Halogeometricum borinquense DSM 11551]|uniref:Uncharacterized protein n=1 Tax=Halogeometricum borinquense (strain ATCC 700274 / DSM 11551 / JCM 10706 / KCTC 4070 / PR3) TaxID=469382 RepID=L9URH6_HALBP|nr:hypothetical protein C499_10514 [Halogeometricum borinquense DSM 11551]
MLSDQRLNTSIQRAMEDRMGDTLGDVRIHTGPSAAKACEDINARAFTVGNHIAFNHGEYDPSSAEGQHILAHELAHVRQQTGAFNHGEYDPSSAEGQHILAHELAHVRQQTGGAVSMLPQAGELEIDPDPRLEREAEETAQRVMQGGKIGVHRMANAGIHVQRIKQWEKQKRDEKGKFSELEERYKQPRSGEEKDKPYANNRPDYADGQVEAVWEQAKDEDGNVYDPNTGERLEWDRGEPREGQWDMGHKPRREYRKLHQKYISGLISKEEFLNRYRDPDNYRPEKPKANRSRKYEGDE